MLKNRGLAPQFFVAHKKPTHLYNEWVYNFKIIILLNFCFLRFFNYCFNVFGSCRVWTLNRRTSCSIPH